MSNFLLQRGQLSYRRKSNGVERGREPWQLSRNRDGSRTLRALAMTDDSKFVRDTTYTVDADGRPTDVFVRLQVDERWVGSGYFRTEGDRLRVVTDTADGGHTCEELEIPDRFHIMTHAVMLDGWTFWSYDFEAGGEQLLTVYNTSTRWDGTDGPRGRLEPLRVTFVGDEEVATPAGPVAAQRFRVSSDVIDSPPSELWVTPEDLLLLRYDWEGFDLEYVQGDEPSP